MKTFKVEITETLQKTIEIEAETHEQAESIVHDQWYKGEHILDADNFTGVDFKVIPGVRVKTKEMER